MKYLLHAAILGFSFWIGSELLEIIQGGYSPTVYYLTAVYHLLALLININNIVISTVIIYMAVLGLKKM